MPAEMPGDRPDPERCRSLDELVGQLRRLKIWAGDPSYETIRIRVSAAVAAAGGVAADVPGRSTVADCFRLGRRRVDAQLMLSVVEALHPDAAYVARWGQALRVVAEGSSATLQVSVERELPEDPPVFTGRAAELGRIRDAGQRGHRVVAISGMAGVGKTGLAVRAGRLLLDEQQFDRVLFVNLRGFHADPTRPPVDPAAVLESFLGLLGVPRHRIPHDREARSAAYRERLAGTRVLVVLDNAIDAEQVRPLIADSPGCLTLVTSRRRLRDLPGATELAVEALTPRDAEEHLREVIGAVAVGADSRALPRIAERCGRLPLALGLVAAHIRENAGWTLTDHAARLDKRHDQHRLDDAVEISFELSYRHLAATVQRLLRLLALHPGHDFDAYAAAALTGAGLEQTRQDLRRLSEDNLLQRTSPGRYTFHDLIRSFAGVLAVDDEPVSGQRAALTRLFDYYLATAAAAMDRLFPLETGFRPRIAAPGVPMPVLDDAESALTWLDTERPALVAAAGRTVTGGWPTHTFRLSAVLWRYLDGGHYTDALTLHGHALHAAELAGEPADQALALSCVGNTQARLGRAGTAVEFLRRALDIYRRTGDLATSANVLNNIGAAEVRLGQYRSAAGHFTQAVELYRQTGGPGLGAQAKQARSLANLAVIEELQGRVAAARDHFDAALALFQQIGDVLGEASTLNGIGHLAMTTGDYSSAGAQLERALILCRQVGHRMNEGRTLDYLGALETRLGRPDRAAEYHREALEIFRASGNPESEAVALLGLGEAGQAAGRTAEARDHHAAALTIAVDIADRYWQARAHLGLGHVHRDLGEAAQARRHYRDAAALYADLGLPPPEELGKNILD